MKTLMIGLTICACAIAAWGEVFQMDRKGDTIVEVQKSAKEYKVTCKFRPQTKFDKAINAKLNDVKGDSLCKKGLARYLKVAPNESLAVAGLYSAAPVKTEGERLCYSFGVPVSGCKVLKAEAKSKPPVEPKKPAVVAEAKPKQLVEPKKPAVVAKAKPKPPVGPKKPTVAADAKPKQLVEPKKPTVDADAKPKPPVEPKKSAVVDPEAPKESTQKLADVDSKTSSFLCVVTYKEINGERKTISRREYRGHNFKSPKDFEQFCQKEFARIRALGEANLRAVRNFRK